MLTHSDDLSNDPLLEPKPNTSDNTEKRLKHSMGMTVTKGSGNFREAAVYSPDQGVRALGFNGSTSRSRNIDNPKRVSKGFQQKDLTTNNTNRTNTPYSM